MIELKSHIGQCALLILADKVRDFVSYCNYEYDMFGCEESQLDKRQYALYIQNVKRVARMLISNIDYELTPHLNDETMEYLKENEDIAGIFVADTIPVYCGYYSGRVNYSDLQFNVELFVNDFIERIKGFAEFLPNRQPQSDWELPIAKQILTDNEWDDLMAGLIVTQGAINDDNGHARNNQGNRTP